MNYLAVTMRRGGLKPFYGHTSCTQRVVLSPQLSDGIHVSYVDGYRLGAPCNIGFFLHLVLKTLLRTYDSRNHVPTPAPLST